MINNINFLIEYGMDNNVYQEAKIIRDEVFLIEQECPVEDEYDDYDQKSYHITGKIDNNLVCCARIVYKQDRLYLGRIAVKKEFRRKHIAYDLLEFLIDYSFNILNVNEIFLEAQVYVKNFYKKHGFIEFGEVFLEANIDHIAMKKTKEEV